MPLPLEKGFSQMDWLRLAQKNPNLNGLGGKPLRTDITTEEVRKHNRNDDAWMVFNGMVYNIGPYLKFHPGGVDVLMKAAGKDGSKLFMKYHPWVNMGALMSKCLVGRLAASDPLQAVAAAEMAQVRLLREQRESDQGGPAAGLPGREPEVEVEKQRRRGHEQQQQQQQHEVEVVD